MNSFAEALPSWGVVCMEYRYDCQNDIFFLKKMFFCSGESMGH